MKFTRQAKGSLRIQKVPEILELLLPQDMLIYMTTKYAYLCKLKLIFKTFKTWHILDKHS